MARRYRLASGVCLLALLRWLSSSDSFVHSGAIISKLLKSRYSSAANDARHVARSLIQLHAGPDAAVAQERPKTAAPSVGSDSFTRLESVLTPEEVAKTLELTRQAYFVANVRLGVSSLNNQAIHQRTLYSMGKWAPDVDHFREALERPMNELNERVMGLGYTEGTEVVISRIFVCRYTKKEQLRGLAPHWDANSMISASCSLSEPQTDSGFYVVEGEKKAFVNLPAGDFAVHGWDTQHGVSTKEDEDRYSLIVWWRPKKGLNKETFFCGPSSDSPNPDALFSRGELAMDHGELDIADKWFNCGIKHGHSIAKLGLAATKALKGELGEAEQMMRKNDDVPFTEVGRLAKKLTAMDFTDAAKALLKGSETPAAYNQLAVVAVKAGEVKEARELLIKAAEGGEVSAMGNLAMFLHKGIGGPADQAAAEKWKQRAIKAASAMAS
eukprot:TRINITY_DN111947_c0_g1_i1.p1 TRINITY_DN111947_c0_g1~~TRINITY_DN111947_c0_g1_i1.p1  ORF type:complete len:441 (-),score=103.00 TRINITY_DN111947_c0_g1_i1:193-1515(-)